MNPITICQTPVAVLHAHRKFKARDREQPGKRLVSMVRGQFTTLLNVWKSRIPTIYIRMSLIITIAVWWSFQAWFSVCRKLLFKEFNTSSRTWSEKKKKTNIDINSSQFLPQHLNPKLSSSTRILAPLCTWILQTGSWVLTIPISYFPSVEK